MEALHVPWPVRKRFNSDCEQRGRPVVKWGQGSFPVRKRTGTLRIWRAWEREPIWGSRGKAPGQGVRRAKPPEAEGILLPKRANLSLSFWVKSKFCSYMPKRTRWTGTRKVKPIWILLKQETVSGISWATCKSAPRSRQITTPAPHHSVFLQVGCPSCHPTNSVKALKVHGQSQHWDIIIRAHYMCITMHNELVSLANIHNNKVSKLIVKNTAYAISFSR